MGRKQEKSAGKPPKPTGRAPLGNAGKGRKKGVPNKVTADVKQALALAFERSGGIDALVKWATQSSKTRTIFYTQLWIKLLPLLLEAKPLPDSRHDTDPRVIEAALALDQAITDAHAAPHPDRAGPTGPPSVPLGTGTPPDPGAPDAPPGGCPATPQREAVPPADGPDAAPAQ